MWCKNKFAVALSFVLFLTTFPARAQKPALEPTAKKMAQLLKFSCYSCHGGQGKLVEKYGDFFASGALTKYVDLLDPKRSLLYKKIESKEMPKDDNGDELTDEERVEFLEAVKSWQLAGAPEISTPDYSDFVQQETILELVQKDLENLPEESRQDYRYVSFLELYNSPYKKKYLLAHEQALSKLLNSLSWRKKIKRPKSIDKDGILFRIRLSDYGWNLASWGRLEQVYPYYGEYIEQKDGYIKVLNLLRTQLPIVRGSWLIASAARPPLYHDLLELPDTLEDLENFIGIRSSYNITSGSIMRLGFLDSGVSQNNRIIERHHSPFGAFWISYDFGSNLEFKDIFSFPLGPDGLFSSPSFKQDGGEVIFNLPNGTQAYFLTNAIGQRIDKGPVQIVSDSSRPDRAVVNGLSCMGCHSSGIILKSDQIWSTSKKLGQFAIPTLQTEDLQHLSRLYNHPNALNTMSDDQNRFLEAMNKAGVTQSYPEVISLVTKLYGSSLSSSAMLLELGLRPTDKIRISRPRFFTLHRELSRKNLVGIKRENFEDLFQKVFSSGRQHPSDGDPSEASSSSSSIAFARLFYQAYNSLGDAATQQELEEACRLAEKSRLLLSQYIRLRQRGYIHQDALAVSRRKGL